MDISEKIKFINYIIAVLFTLCYLYQYFYIPVSWVKRKFRHKKTVMHRFGILICARNESAVIGDLLNSLKNQTYPRDLLTVFVMADNCTDNTADIARAAGAVVYERFNDTLIGKGYALNMLLENIKKDYGDTFDAYFIFDADNLLETDYIEQMNKTYSDGYNVVTSYRNSKNFGDNWISAGYALWFLREARYLNHPRMALHSCCAVSGTGFMFARSIIEKAGGWNFFLLTEDIEFTVYNALNDEKIGYCPDAVLYDEQPTGFKTSWHQRLRWVRGYIQVVRKYGLRLIRGLFSKNCFSCFDMIMVNIPAAVLSAAACIANAGLIIYRVIANYYDSFTISIGSVFELIARLFGVLFLIGAITTATEWKNIHAKPWKKVLYTFTFPIYMSTYFPIAIAALFITPEWKQVQHKSASIDDIKKS